MLKKACYQTVLMWGCLGPSGNFEGFTGALAHMRHDCSRRLYVHAVPLSISSILGGFCLPLFRTLLSPFSLWLTHACFRDLVRILCVVCAQPAFETDNPSFPAGSRKQREGFPL